MKLMQSIKQWLFIALLAQLTLGAGAQAQTTFTEQTKPDTTFRRCFVGSSAFMLMNVLLEEPADFYQINFGHWLTKKDVVSVEFKTWKYIEPMGVPWGSSMRSKEVRYPGYVRTFGVALAYQRFLWKGLYTALHTAAFQTNYHYDSGEPSTKGFQIFMTGRLGYHLKFFNDRFFIEPGVAFTHWPVNTHVPESFKALDDKWPTYFLFEPGLHFGYKFNQ